VSVTETIARWTGRWTTEISLVLLLMAMAVPALAQGEKISDAMKPVAAATRIFALEHHLHGDIGIADEDEGHIGEEFEVNHEPGQKCTFTMKRRDGPIVESISFDRLSDEYRTSRRDIYTLVVISGQPGAQCEYVGRSKKCSNSLELLLFGSELDLAARALRYIFSNVCKPAELPF
jgi:hypothetical protein